MILIYTHKTSLRLKYILNFFFKDLYGIEYMITHSREEFQSSQLSKFTYGNEEIGNNLHISTNGLIFENGIKEQNIPIGDWEGVKIIFKNLNPTLPFDIFSAGFYLLTRYEEYLPHIRDKYDRFEAENSLAFQHGFLKEPIINIWAQKFKELLKKNFPELTFKEHQYNYISTIDIDNAYAFKQKGLMRTIGGYGRAFVNFFWIDAKERTKVLLGKMKDPYDTYKLQMDLQKKYNLAVIYFILLGDYGENDKNLPSNNQKFQSLIKHLNDYAQVGIHPSFGSNGNSLQVRKEINRLIRITNHEITKSRQHFLILHLPQTYKILVENGISDDYTMGYASQIGFRASTCSAFYWYDLDTETETSLLIHPFAIMDATLRFYMKVKPEEVENLVRPIINSIKANKGTFITIWHNETISDWREWKGWQHVYETVVKLAI